MSLEELEKEYNAVKRELLRANRDTRDMNKEIDSIIQEIEYLEQSIETRLSEERDHRFMAHLSAIKSPLIEKKTSLEDEIDYLEKEHESDLSALSLDVITQEIIREDRSASSLQGISEDLEKSVIAFVGERFYREFAQQLEAPEEVLEGGELDKVLSHCEDIFNKAKRMGVSGGVNPKSTLDSLIGSLENSRERIGGGVKYGAVVTGALVLSWFVFPFYLLILVKEVVDNTRKARVMSKLAVALKTIETNRQAYNEKVNESAEVKYNELKSKLENDFSEKMKELSGELSLVEYELKEADELAENSFYFDEEAFRENLMEPLELQRKQYQLKFDESNFFKTKTEELTSIMDELKKKLDEEQADAEAKYWTPTLGSELILDTKYHIGPMTDRQSICELSNSQANLIFFEKDYEAMAKNFAKGLLFLTRNKLVPTSLKIKILDEHTTGSDFLTFYKSTDKIFQIRTDPSEIKEEVGILLEDVMKRTEIIKRDFLNITDYNEKMIEIESVPETYVFVVIWNPTQELIDNPSLQKVMNQGAELGVHVLVFMDSSKIDMNSLKLLPYIGRTHILDDEGYKKIAKQALLESICQLKNIDLQKAREVSMLT